MDTRASTAEPRLWLLGGSLNHIPGHKLPSNGQVLRRLINIVKVESKSVKDAATIVTHEINNFWERARIPSRQSYHVIKKITTLYDSYKKIQKNASTRTANQISLEETFTNTLDDLFDIAHADALSLITIPEDKEFLLAQREKGRRGYMAGVDKALTGKEERRYQREATLEARQKLQAAAAGRLEETVTLESSSSSPGSSPERRADPEFRLRCTSGAGSSTSKAGTSARGTVDLVLPSLASALDRSKMSNKTASLVLAATVDSLGLPTEDFKISVEKIRQARQANRKKIDREIRKSFAPEVPLVIHWDSKIMLSLDTTTKVDRVAICVSGEGITKLLGIPILENGTGEATATAVYESILDWNVQDQIKFMSFDTTSVNTGRLAGASVLLQKKMSRRLIGVACRHHVLELVIGAAFGVSFGDTKSPEVAIFKRFKEEWRNIDPTRYIAGIKDPVVKKALEEKQELLIANMKSVLQRGTVRADYKEVVELGLLFLGETPSENYNFRRPGAMHHARWMSKVLYGLKIFLFREQFQLTEVEQNSLRRFVIFTTKAYVGAWFRAAKAISAPRRDLEFLKSLTLYEDEQISKQTVHTFINHLWYLNQHLVGLAFFDKEVPVETKRQMVTKLEVESGTPIKPRALLTIEMIEHSKLSDFVSTDTRLLFDALGIETDFLNFDPEHWDQFPSYNLGIIRANNIQVVNDIAERAVGLAQDFNSILTNQEEQKQFLYQVVEQHRKQFPQATKANFASNFRK